MGRIRWLHGQNRTNHLCSNGAGDPRLSRDGGPERIHLQAVPSPALMPALIPSHQRPIAKNLFDISKMEEWLDGRNHLTKQAMKSLKEANNGGENVVPCYPMRYSGGRRVEVMMGPDCRKQQLLDLGSIASSPTHTNFNALLHFKAVKASRPCHCLLYLATSPPEPTLLGGKIS